MDPKSLFETSDLYLSSALQISGFKLINVKKNGNGRGVFVFEDKPNRSTIVREYFNGELKGSLKAFSNAWSDLKSLLSQI